MRIAVVAFDGCMTSAVFGLMDAFAIASRLARQAGASRWNAVSVDLVTETGHAVQGLGGHRIEPTGALAGAAGSDVVLVPPIMGDVEEALIRERGLIGWLAGLGEGPTAVASCCTGAFLLAEAGLLAGRRITTNPRFRALFEGRYPDVALALDERIVEDRKVICAGSTTAFLDLAVHVVDRLGGHDLAVATAKALSMDRNPASQRPYLMFIAPRDHGDERVLALQEWIEAHHASPIGAGDIARAGAMSLRNLARRFSGATGQSPVQYLRTVRLETAKRLLEVEPTSIERVAARVGYADTRAFMRAFGAFAGISPGEYRRRFRADFG